MARAAASVTSSISSRLVAATRSPPAELSIRSLSSERSCWRMSPAILDTTRPKSTSGGRTDHREVVVPAPQVVDDADRRRDQRRAREQTQAESSQQPAGLFSGLIDLGHRGMEGGGAPEEVEADPAGVEPDLVVVRALHEHQAVDEVRGQQADDAGDHQVEGQAALAAVERQPHRHRQQQHVGQRVRHRHQSSGGGQRMVVDVGGDQPHPRGERQPDRHDGRVDRAAAVAPADSPSLEDQHARDQRRIHREICTVADRRERHLAVEQQGVAVGVQVAEPEEEESEGHAHPREARLRAVHPDAGRDGEHGREAEHVDHRPAAGERLDEQVQRRDERSGAQEHNPRPRGDAGAVAGARRHAASLSSSPRGRSSPSAASVSSAAISVSTSPSVFAAVS